MKLALTAHASKHTRMRYTSYECGLKPHLHRNANRTQTQHAKTMRTFDVDVFPEARQTAFGCAMNVQQTAECYPPNVGTSKEIRIQHV